jgi:hypothetical protein
MANATVPAEETLYSRGYRILGYFGLMSVFAAMIYGFRHDPEASGSMYLLDLALYAAFITPHLLLTRSSWKQRVWGDPSGSSRERRVYIALTLVTWLGLLWLHWPLPGAAIDLPEELRFAGLIGFLWSLLWFFEGSTREALDGLLGVPGTVMHYSHGSETPLHTEGPYARVRHPMYRFALLAGMCALVVHPNVAQLFWISLIGATFIAFIPVEEAQLMAARGDDYRRYRQQVPYRLFRGIW